VTTFFGRTRVFTVTTTNAQNTLQHFQGESALKTFHFFEGGCLCSSKKGGGACAMAQWHNGHSKPAITCAGRPPTLLLFVEVDPLLVEMNSSRNAFSIASNLDRNCSAVRGQVPCGRAVDVAGSTHGLDCGTAKERSTRFQ